MFDLVSDPGENTPLSSTSSEYSAALDTIKDAKTNQQRFCKLHLLPPMPDAPLSVPPIQRPGGVLAPEHTLVVQGGGQAFGVG